ncbi:DNA replication initiation control protein YabA [Macrococcus armenti]|uniref:DNA replication initiation control protein YabA n=1 Tax=Macrococcus armenti TaxID=2875764 RepID=UPI001CCE1633|nr:DNA replication initiation control protein YabA [Macrococcus armenti]UBH08565.1 DNA replication initiation control protein YabA [Macrococcus armenti]UBH10850.1 DNA replication initiation control protein YabA [Macrococcus armenti]UBH15331.1 DNA replication initiation control protein YabA [Macrococcus armenti]UBH17689.1 DNA replication initiation control protein YabA [Macrococcus armenti]UBH19956.1 DNA replication initiation control protein YabA [Macrococcus armenti]
MNRDEMLKQLSQLEKDIKQINESYDQLKNMVVALIEENVTLNLEIENMQMFINEPKKEEAKAPKKSTVLQSKDNLAMLYAEGFHICPTDLFGKHRGGEGCIFCLNLLSDKK